VSNWQVFLLVAHSLVCVGIIVLTQDLARLRRNAGHKPGDLLVVAYIMGSVGAALYLAEPVHGDLPTFADLVFESAALLFLLVLVRNPSLEVAHR
jgi:low temperature requirement protein LtrA